MIIRSLEGDDAINDFAMKVMELTVSRLVAEELLTESQAGLFVNTHICMMAPNDGWLKAWLKRRMHPEAVGDLGSRILIATVPL